MDISSTYLKFINSVETQFDVFSNDYTELINEAEDGNTDIFKKELLRWYHHSTLESPLWKMMSSIIEFEEQGAFITEIKNCLLANYLGPIEYTKILLERQYRFIQLKFPDIVNYYFNNIDESYELLELLLNASEELSDEKILKAVQIHFLEVFLTFEEEFYLGYPLYQKVIIPTDAAVRNSYIPEYIRLDYGDNDEEVIKAIYNILKQGYIQPISIEEFSSYFSPGSPPKKMRWLKNDILLLILFQGKNIGLREGRRDLRIKTMNNRPLKIICDNFIKKDGSEFVNRHLERNKKNLLAENNQGATEIIDLLIDVYMDIPLILTTQFRRNVTSDSASN